MPRVARHLVVLAALGVVLLAWPGPAAAQRDGLVLDPIPLVERLQRRTAGLGLDRGLHRSLTSKLDAALASLRRAQARAATGQLHAFQNEVRAHRGLGPDAIFVYEADGLVAQAGVIVKAVVEPGTLISDPNDLLYLGGSILEFPKVYLTFWGWGPDRHDPDGEIPVLQGFLQHIGGTPYLETLTQYSMTDPSAPGGKRFITNPVNLLAGVWFDDVHPLPAFVDTPDIEQEVRESVKVFGYDPDAIYFIATPPSRAWFESACAYHASTSAGPHPTSVAYVDFPYQPTVCAGLGLGGAAATTVIAFHEIAEAMNDPRYSDQPKPPNAPVAEFPPNFGWVNRNGDELADICGTLQGFPALPITLAGVTYSIQALWSNQAHGCVYSTP